MRESNKAVQLCGNRFKLPPCGLSVRRTIVYACQPLALLFRALLALGERAESFPPGTPRGCPGARHAPAPSVVHQEVQRQQLGPTAGPHSTSRLSSVSVFRFSVSSVQSCVCVCVWVGERVRVCVCVCETAGVYVCSPCNAGLLGCLIAGGGGVSLGLIFSFPATPSGGVRCTCQGHAIRHATQTTTTSSTSRSSSSKER